MWITAVNTKWFVAREARFMQFQTELEYFIANQEKLVKEFGDKVLIIKGQQVVGIYETVLAAYVEAQKTYELGTFMIQHCAPGPDAYTVTINLDYASNH